MPYRSRNRGLRLRPVNTLKHTVDTQSVIAAGTDEKINLVDVADNPPSTTANLNSTGSTLNGIFLNVQVVNSTNSVGLINNVYMYVILNPGNNFTPADFPLVNEVGIGNFRKMVFHQEMAMLSDANDSIPITLFKGVLAIPKKARRLGINDRVVLVVGTPVGGAEIDVCVQCIYKEIR